ncbi:MAG: ribonuclease J [Erysipelotrichaceae bacterium]
MEKIRVFALGGLDENGKNMYCVEIDDKIIVIDAGIKFPESSNLGVEFIIPDFKYLAENAAKVKGIFITHAHDDVMKALPFLLKQVQAPIYTGALTASILRDYLKKEGIKNFKINKIKRTSRQKVDGIDVRTFAMTHAFPDNFGVAIATSQGYIVYNGEFLVDYDILSPEFNFDINELADIGKKGVLCLLSESTFADKPGASAPRHRISDVIEPMVASAQGRVIVSAYAQSLFRMMEIIEVAKKYNRKLYFHDADARVLLQKLEELNYYTLDKRMVVTDKMFKDSDEDIMVVVTGNVRNVFKIMQNIAMHEDRKVKYRLSDTVIIASPVVSGSEVDASNMENEFYKEGGKVYLLKSKQVLSMHPSMEDLKMMLNLFKPKYYIPIKGEYRHLIANANIATKVGYTADKIIVLDNGQMATFENKALKNTSKKLNLDDVLIDGRDDLDVSGPVLKDREILSTDGVIIFGVTLDFKTKKIIGGPDIQTRGVIYLKDAEHILSQMMEIAENTINKMVENKQYENMAARGEVRDKISRYLSKETGKRPMVLPVIIEINQK